MKKPKAILFDYDGTLSDTMNIHYSAWIKALNNYNHSFKKKDFFKLEGHSLELICLNFLKSKQNADYDIKKIINLKKNIFNKSVIKDNYYPHVLKIIKLLKKSKIKIALVTSSHKAQINNSSSSFFLDYFDFIVCGDEVKKNKPNPDPYLLASNKLGVKPSDCLVVENAPIGIMAAKNARMKSLAITNTLNPYELSGADIIIKNFSSMQYLNIF